MNYSRREHVVYADLHSAKLISTNTDTVAMFLCKEYDCHHELYTKLLVRVRLPFELLLLEDRVSRKDPPLPTHPGPDGILLVILPVDFLFSGEA